MADPSTEEVRQVVADVYRFDIERSLGVGDMPHQTTVSDLPPSDGDGNKPTLTPGSWRSFFNDSDAVHQKTNGSSCLPSFQGINS